MTLPPPECQVYTPPQLAAAMVQALEPSHHDYWLDPCIGSGAFIAPLRKKGIPKERIVGIDIDSKSGAEDGAARTVRGVDFFQWCASTQQKFGRIIANPPYVAIRKLHPKLQRSLIAFDPTTDASFALRSNYWCAFLSASLRVLAYKGNLAFVLPAAWDYALYASDIR
jgi:adenine-specific DNA-methyltransferase